jgi:hypothetical protein
MKDFMSNFYLIFFISLYFSFLHIFQAGSRIHPAYYLKHTVAPSLGVKRPGHELLLLSIQCQGHEYIRLYFHSFVRVHFVVLN